MGMTRQVSFSGTVAIFADVDGVSLQAVPSSSSLNSSLAGFDRFTSSDALSNSLCAVSCSLLASDMAGSISETLNQLWER